MNLHTRQRTIGFTLVELVVVLAAIVLVAAVLLPVLARPKSNHDPIIRCVNNLKQVGLSFRLWAGDNDEKYPMRVPVAIGGTMELADNGLVAPHLAVMSNELGTPKILACRVDGSREVATNFTFLQDSNVSYFINLSASEDKPAMWLAGDRNVMIGQATVQGLVEVNANSQVNWSETMHNERGAVALADGSVQQYSQRQLLDSLRAQTNLTSRLVFP